MCGLKRGLKSYDVKFYRTLGPGVTHFCRTWPVGHVSVNPAVTVLICVLEMGK